MILMVSGRTDIVAFYSDWFMNRYKEGFVDVRNPFNPTLVNRIYFKDVDLILFCSKNPLPILDKITQIDKPILFHITLTPYKEEIELNVPNKKHIIEAIKKISSLIGKENVYVRYDPIFISNKYSITYHQKAFEKLCFLLKDNVQHIIISFLDVYKNVKNNEKILKHKEISQNDYQIIGKSFFDIASRYNITIQTCFEKYNLTEFGFIKDECISVKKAFQLTGKIYKKWQARKCGCVEMVDIGAYNTCNHLCKYCYANFDEKQIKNNIEKHNTLSSLLIGELTNQDKIKIRNK